MNDFFGAGLRRRESKVVSALRRVIPGDYKTVTEAAHPVLSEIGFDFSDARVVEDSTKSAPGLFLATTVAERHEPVAGAIRATGSWTFILDCSAGVGASALWLLTVMDFPDRFIKQLPETSGSSGPVLLRKLRSGWLVGLQATQLKDYIKNGRRDHQL